MGLSQLTMKVWDGDVMERFRPSDMNRICYNANALAEACGVKPASFPEVVHSDQFRYDYTQLVEDITADCAEVMGLSLNVETAWGPGRSLSYTDFERIESNLFRIYRALGGVGERIPAERRRLNYSAMLFAGDWVGTGPWHQDITSPIVTADRELVAFVPHTATVQQRHAEVHALLRVETIGDRRVRVTASGVKPRINVPIRLALGGLDMQETVTLKASGWTGSGPWYQSVSLSDDIVDGIIGVTEGTTNAQVQAIASAGIFPSAISGSTLTVRAQYAKPSIDLTVGVRYDTKEVA